MQQLNLPEFQAKTRLFEGQHQIFDGIRRKYVALTPEEWVRQHLINYLVIEKKFPNGLLAVEYPLIINKVKHRADVVAFNSKGKPILVVECKAPEVNINNDVILQISRYNILLKAPFLIVSNGIVHFCVKVDFKNSSTQPLSIIPYYAEISSVEI